MNGSPPPDRLGTSRHVLVTGASSGIGAATVATLLGRGHAVTACVRRAVDAEDLRARHGAHRSRLATARFDVADPDTVAGEVGRIAEGRVADGRGTDGRGADGRATPGDATVGQPLDAVVANAGTALGAPLAHLPAAELRHVLDVNVVGTLAVVQAALPALLRGDGRVVVIGSVAGRVAGPMLGAYAASKAAVASLTDVLRAELAPRGLPVVLVEPGVVATPIWRRGEEAADAVRAGLGEAARAEYRDQWDRMVAEGRRNAEHGAPPERVARTVLRAVEAGRPRPRYLVGADARMGAAVGALPARLRDRLVAAPGPAS